ncbi:MAG TPA: ABC transporter substrate-binding protein, partial [Candidatus Methylacidiphilales bacterium]
MQMRLTPFIFAALAFFSLWPLPNPASAQDALKPADTATPVEPPKPAETAAPAETPKPADSITPAESPKGADTAQPAPASQPAEVAKTGEAQCHHAMSLVGDPKFGPDFKNFDWVNPDAPKGGTVRQWADGTFDTLNPFSDKGVKAAGLGLLYDSLFTPSPDEPSTQYALIAECASYPDDFSSVTFKLRPEAKFNDGTPITPEDVIYSFEQFKKVNPFYAFYY